jgi:TonB-dependent SusC/RagA subfamily outer membrane receptor
MALILSHLSMRAQSDRVTLRVTDASLESILQELVQQTGYSYRNTGQSLTNGNLITLHIRNVTLPEALDVVFKNQPFQYKLENKTIIVADKPLPPAVSTNLVKGRVTDEQGKPVEAVTIEAKPGGKKTTTNANGEFSITVSGEQDSLLISHVSYEKRVEKVKMRRAFNIQLFPSSRALEQVVISSYVRTGHQQIAEQQMTGSFVYVDSQQFNRRISTHFIDRIENMATGVLFSKNQGGGSVAGQDVIVRGISTIYGSKRPLIVIDNFPYDGDINNINPNDIESITILKDAVATGLWGAFAGNGVIVVTTKKGQFDQAPQVSLVSNIMISDKPDLNYLPLMNSADYMEVTKFLYEKGFYNTRINSPYALVPPDVMILDSMQNNLLTQDEGQQRLDMLKANDLRSDLAKYFYRKSVNQQYAININGGGNKMRYYFSAGYDKNLPNLARNYYERITLNANNVYWLMKDKIELTAGVGFTQSNTANNNSGTVVNRFPYTRLVDETGNPAIVQADYRQSYKDGLANLPLLNWDYRPLRELMLSSDLTRLSDYRIIVSAQYNIVPEFYLSAQFQYG